MSIIEHNEKFRPPLAENDIDNKLLSEALDLLQGNDRSESGGKGLKQIEMDNTGGNFLADTSMSSGKEKSPGGIFACAARVPDEPTDWRDTVTACVARLPREPGEIFACAAIVDKDAGRSKEKELGDPSKTFDSTTVAPEKNSSEEPLPFQARTQLATGDSVSTDGEMKTVEMPSGEKLVVDGKSWSLQDKNGNEIANQRTPAGVPVTLDNGAQLVHVVPILGPGWWNLKYPDGDSISISGKNGKVTINRDGQKGQA